MIAMQARTRPPWTVVTLIAFGVAGTLWGALSGTRTGLGIAIDVGVCALFSWAFWNAQRWAFNLAFAGVVLGGTLGTWAVFMADTTLGFRIYWIGSMLLYLFLLRHPETQRFLGLHQDQRPA